MINRTIGAYTQGEEGPLLICLGGIHGNEPAGVHALERVLGNLRGITASFKGTFLALRGNCAALVERKRYIDKDLNRLWAQEEIDRVRALPEAKRNSEERELLELLRIIDVELSKPYPTKILVDLHTTSAPGGLFSIVSNDPFNRELAAALHAPVIFNFMTSLSTTTNIFIDEHDLKGLAFESGQHDDPASVDLHEAAIWLLLERAGCISYQDVDEMDRYHHRLITASRRLPHYMRVVYRHEIQPEDRFHMYPGYSNFHKVYRDEPVARDHNGIVKCPQSGMMLMPLYQAQGEEGFFIIQPIEAPPE